MGSNRPAAGGENQLRLTRGRPKRKRKTQKGSCAQGLEALWHVLWDMEVHIHVHTHRKDLNTSSSRTSGCLGGSEWAEMEAKAKFWAICRAREAHRAFCQGCKTCGSKACKDISVQSPADHWAATHDKDYSRYRAGSGNSLNTQQQHPRGRREKISYYTTTTTTKVRHTFKQETGNRSARRLKQPIETAPQESQM